MIAVQHWPGALYNRARLKKIKSSLEFKLRLQELSGARKTGMMVA